MENKPKVLMLVFKILYGGFDYEYIIDCELEAKAGDYLISDANILKGRDSWVNKQPMITITSVDDEKVNCLISSECVDGYFLIALDK